jgi:hypothetical protein
MHAAIRINMKVNGQIQIGCSLKINRFKMRHASYSNRWAILVKSQGIYK